MKIYFAGPLFSQAERDFNLSLTNQLEQLEFTVFLPQRDGVESTKPPYSQMEPNDRRKALFALDKRQAIECDIFLFVLDGRIPDEGACVELGLAHMYQQLSQPNKLLIGLRTGRFQVVLNPMIKIALDEIYDSVDQLLAKLKSLNTPTS